MAGSGLAIRTRFAMLSKDCLGMAFAGEMIVIFCGQHLP